MKAKIKATVFDSKDRVVACRYNSYKKTHPLQAKLAFIVGEPERKYLHAEVAALIAAKNKGCSIHIERYDSKGNPKLAKPCSICREALKLFNIKEVSYTIG